MCNLAAGTAADRARHMKKYKNNSSKVTGVAFDYRLKVWEVGDPEPGDWIRH